MSCSKSLLVLIWFFASIQTSFSQQSETGLPPFGSFHGSDLDLVSLQNGNLHIEIPMLSLPQRAGVPFGYNFVYDIPSWQILDWAPTPTTLQWTVSQTPGELAGWNVLTDPTAVSQIYYDVVPKSCTYVVQGTTYTNNYNVYTNYTIQDTHGTKHPFEVRHLTQPLSGCQDPTGNQDTGAALDGSGITIAIVSNGTGAIGSMPDDAGPLNGNSPDTLGRTFALQTGTTGGLLWQTYTAHDSNGNSQEFRIDYIPVLEHTSFCPLLNVGSTPCAEYGPISPNLPQKLTLPNGTFYQFTWSTDGNADLLRIDLPTGGYLAYGYQTYTRFVRTVSGAGGKGKGTPTKV